MWSNKISEPLTSQKEKKKLNIIKNLIKQKTCSLSKSKRVEHFIEIGNLYKDLKKNSEALNYYDEALATKKDLYIVYYYKGLVYRDEKKIKESIESFEKSLFYNQKFETYIDMSITYYFENNIENAIKTLNKYLISSTEQKSKAFLYKIYFYIKSEKFNDALKECNIYLDKQADDQTAQFLKGVILTYLKEYSQANEIFQNINIGKLDPFFDYVCSSYSKKIIKDIEKNKKELTKTLINSHILEKAELCLESGELENSLKNYLEYIEKQISLSNEHLKMAKSRISNNKPKAALDSIQSAKYIYNSIESQVLYCEILEKQNKHEEILVLLKNEKMKNQELLELFEIKSYLALNNFDKTFELLETLCKNLKRLKEHNQIFNLLEKNNKKLLELKKYDKAFKLLEKFNEILETKPSFLLLKLIILESMDNYEIEKEIIVNKLMNLEITSESKNIIEYLKRNDNENDLLEFLQKIKLNIKDSGMKPEIVNAQIKNTKLLIEEKKSGIIANNLEEKQIFECLDNIINENLKGQIINDSLSLNRQINYISSILNTEKLTIATGYIYSSGLKEIKYTLDKALKNNCNIHLIAGSLQNYYTSEKIKEMDKNTATHLNSLLKEKIELYTLEKSFYHGKIYIWETSNQIVTILGSSNVSHQAFSLNKELNIINVFNKETPEINNYLEWITELKNSCTLIKDLDEDRFIDLENNEVEIIENMINISNEVDYNLSDKVEKMRMDLWRNHADGLISEISLDKYPNFKNYILFELKDQKYVIESKTIKNACYFIKGLKSYELKKLLLNIKKTELKEKYHAIQLNHQYDSKNHDYNFEVFKKKALETFSNL